MKNAKGPISPSVADSLTRPPTESASILLVFALSRDAERRAVLSHVFYTKSVNPLRWHQTLLRRAGDYELPRPSTSAAGEMGGKANSVVIAATIGLGRRGDSRARGCGRRANHEPIGCDVVHRRSA